MIKSHYNKANWPVLAVACTEATLAVQGFDTSISSILVSSITDEGAFTEMSGKEDASSDEPLVLYHDPLDLVTEHQRKFVENLVEHDKQVSGYYESTENITESKVETTSNDVNETLQSDKKL